jgi:hypothetical protein
MSDRRSFLRDGLRALVFGSLALTGIVLGGRRPAQNNSCHVDLACRDCARLAGCGESRADRFRESGLPGRQEGTAAEAGRQR